MNVYEELGVPVVVNGVGPATRLGGLPISDEVWHAMREASLHSVRISDLQIAAGRTLAKLLSVPACYVTSGAASALHLATASMMTRDDPALIDRLPDVSGMRSEVVVQRAHRDPYDHAVTSTGATLVEIGYPKSTHSGELRRALTSRTAAVLFRPGATGNLLGLAEFASIAHEQNIPVIIDAALITPPLDRLTGLFDDGADLIAVSGGKGLRAPQATGLLCGRPELIDLVSLHHQDMDEREQTWHTAAERPGLRTPPRHGIGRPMKVGREQIIGLVAAVQQYLRAPDDGNMTGINELEIARRHLQDGGVVPVEKAYEHSLNVPVLHLDLGALGLDVDRVVRDLAQLPTPVILGEDLAWRSVLIANPMALRPGNGIQLAESVNSVCRLALAEGESGQ